METKKALMQKHRDLIKEGHLLAAKWLLGKLLKGNANITVWDTDHAVWESGLVDWIMANYKWFNGRIASFHFSA